MRRSLAPPATTTRHAARRISSTRAVAAGVGAACSVPAIRSILTDTTVRSKVETATTTSIPPLDHPLEEGWTLPARWYTDPGVHERERDRLFARAWMYAGPAEWVAEPGSYFAAQIGHVP